MNKYEYCRLFFENKIKQSEIPYKYRQEIRRDYAHLAVFSQMVFHYINGINNIPHCKNCLNLVKWHKGKYQEYCSIQCRNKSPEIIEKIRNILLQKYNVKSIFQLDEIRNKALHSIKINKDSITEKRKKTNKSKYGVEVPSQSKTIRNKINKTVNERYVSWPYNQEYAKIKRENTNIVKYGFKSVFSAEEIQNKISKTNLKRYGSTRYINSKYYIEKNKTMMDRYGYGNPNQKHIPLEILKLSSDDIVNLNKTKTLTEMSIDLGVSIFWLQNRLKQGNYETILHSKSILHRKIEKLLFDNNITFSSNNRKIIAPFELDIFLPEYNLAFEINGSYWHSENSGKDRFYHINKTNLCLKKGIQLIHIWEHLYNFQEEIYHSIIKTSVNLSNKLYARKCIIKQLTKEEEKHFFKLNHIQGYIPSKICYGLVNDGKIVQAMSFSKPRYNKMYEWELLRLANLCNHVVIGGSSRLFKKFVKENNPSTIISYSDKSLFMGKVYSNMGFKHQAYSAPNYYYTNDYKNYFSRIKFQKHKLKSLLEKYDNNLTEWENMQLNGYDRIWDCGNDVWAWGR